MPKGKILFFLHIYHNDYPDKFRDEADVYFKFPIMKIFSFLRAMTLLVTLMAGFYATSSAQRIDEEDVIYLKNGSIIRGQILEQVIGDYVKIELVGGTIFSYTTEEIEKITREPAKYSYIKLKYRNDFRPVIFREKGIYNILSFGLGFSEGRWGPEAVPTLQYRMGYRFHHLLNVGAGTGLDPYNRGLITPFFLDIHGELEKKRIAPHYFANVGYGVGSSSTWGTLVFDGGLMGHAGAGLKLSTRSRNEWYFTVGYKFQHSYQEFEDWEILWNNWNWNNGNPPVLEPPIVRGTRLYQKVVWQIAWGF
ncbi:MAG: hypothetical protein SF052_00985 [Bacteroidia bacterium]|nr:hypothetical protein [Bacteroidia bacterium]